MADPLLTQDERTWLPTDHDLDRLQRTTILYDLHEINPDNGLVRDKTDPAARTLFCIVPAGAGVGPPKSDERGVSAPRLDRG